MRVSRRYNRATTRSRVFLLYYFVRYTIDERHSSFYVGHNDMMRCYCYINNMSGRWNHTRIDKSRFLCGWKTPIVDTTAERYCKNMLTYFNRCEGYRSWKFHSCLSIGDVCRFFIISTQGRCRLSIKCTMVGAVVVIIRCRTKGIKSSRMMNPRSD